MGRKVDIIGLIFGSWEVIEIAHKTNNGHYQYKVRCANCTCEKLKTIPEIKQNLTCIACRGLSKGQAGLNEIYDKYCRNAKKFGRNFDLTVEDVKILTSSNCHYCGTEPLKIKSHRRQHTSWGNYCYNGIDRRDNQLGYSLDNCLPCCNICNRAKNDMPYDKFIDYLNRVAKYMNR